MQVSLSQFGLLILAAGKSQRMGFPKGLLKFSQRTWIEEQLSRFQAAGGKSAALVLGNDHARYRAQLNLSNADPCECEIEKIKTMVIRSPAPALGPMLSVQVGISALDWRRLNGIIILPIDTPLMHPESLKAFINQLNANSLITKPCVAGVSGHPIVIAPDLAHEINKLAIDRHSRLDRFIDALPPETIGRVEVNDKSVLMNLNTPADWQEYLKRF